MGKKPKGPYAGKSLVFSTRITPDLRAKLGAAATEKGYSLSQEIEERLRDSFTLEQKMADSFGSPQNYLIMRIVALAMQWSFAPGYFGQTANRDFASWTSDPAAFDVVFRTVVNVLELMRPPKPASSAGRDDDPRQIAIDDFSSKQISAAIWQAIQRADVAAPIDKGTRDEHLMGLLKRKLGPIADRPQPTLLTAADLRKMVDTQTELASQAQDEKPSESHRSGKRAYQPRISKRKGKRK